MICILFYVSQATCEEVEYGGGAEGEDYVEEDFVMDLDIFSPLQSTHNQIPKQPRLPDYLPLEVEPEVVSESGEFVLG